MHVEEAMYGNLLKPCGPRLTWSLTNVTKTAENDVKIKMADVNAACFKEKMFLFIIQASAPNNVQEKEYRALKKKKKKKKKKNKKQITFLVRKFQKFCVWFLTL